MFAFGGVDVDEYPFCTTDIVIIQQWSSLHFQWHVCPVFLLRQLALPKIATPPLRITVHTSAKSTFIWPVLLITSVIHFAAVAKTFIRFCKAFIFKLPNWWRSLSLLITSNVSTWSFNISMPSSAWSNTFLSFVSKRSGNNTHCEYAQIFTNFGQYRRTACPVPPTHTGGNKMPFGIYFQYAFRFLPTSSVALAANFRIGTGTKSLR